VPERGGRLPGPRPGGPRSATGVSASALGRAGVSRRAPEGETAPPRVQAIAEPGKMRVSVWARRDLNPHIGEISPITDMNPEISEKSPDRGSHASTIAGAPRPASSGFRRHGWSSRRSRRIGSAVQWCWRERTFRFREFVWHLVLRSGPLTPRPPRTGHRSLPARRRQPRSVLARRARAPRPCP
jgi:hypothetical protein